MVYILVIPAYLLNEFIILSSIKTLIMWMGNAFLYRLLYSFRNMFSHRFYNIPPVTVSKKARIASRIILNVFEAAAGNNIFFVSFFHSGRSMASKATFCHI